MVLSGGRAFHTATLNHSCSLGPAATSSVAAFGEYASP